MTRYSFHGLPVPDWQVPLLPDRLVLHDHHADVTSDVLDGLVVRRRTEREKPVPAPRKAVA